LAQHSLTVLVAPAVAVLLIDGDIFLETVMPLQRDHLAFRIENRKAGCVAIADIGDRHDDPTFADVIDPLDGVRILSLRRNRRREEHCRACYNREKGANGTLAMCHGEKSSGQPIDTGKITLRRPGSRAIIWRGKVATRQQK
jgi:hypothetical protein